MNLERLQHEFDVVRTELQICRRKLDSKCEALLILTKDLDQCRQERDQFKLMAEQVQARYQSIKRQLAGVAPRINSLEGVPYSDMKHQSLAHLLCEMRDVNKSLQFEVDDLRQKLRDANGDIKLLREQIARHRVGTTDEGLDTRHFPAHEREELVHRLESVRDQLNQMERDLQQVLDEKEELVTERDVYRNKYDRLNKELNYILKGDEKCVLDIDNLVMENRYLQERIRQVEDEKCMALSTISKYKNMLDRKKSKGILKLGQNRSGGVVISQKQVHQLLEIPVALSPTPQMVSDLQSLASALLETLNDKNTALSHQRKTNKILGTRVSELENKLKTLEVAGLWNFPERSQGLEKLKLDCEEIKLLFPSKLADCISSSDHQTNASADETSVDRISENLVDLDESVGITSPTQTDPSSGLNSDSEVGMTPEANASPICRVLISTNDPCQETADDVLTLSGLFSDRTYCDCHKLHDRNEYSKKLESSAKQQSSLALCSQNIDDDQSPSGRTCNSPVKHQSSAADPSNSVFTETTVTDCRELVFWQSLWWNSALF